VDGRDKPGHDGESGPRRSLGGPVPASDGRSSRVGPQEGPDGDDDEGRAADDGEDGRDPMHRHAGGGDGVERAGVGNHAAASVHLPRLFGAALASLARNLLLPEVFERSNVTLSAKLAFLRRSDDVR
jgi:hypothetical protein